MSTAMTKRLTLGLVALLFVGLSACSSGGDNSRDTSAREPTEATDTTDDTGSAGDAGAATEEQCQSLGAVPEDAAALDETVALFPDDLQDDVRRFSEDLVAYVTSVDDETGEPTGNVPEASQVLTTFTAGCAELLGSDNGGDHGPAQPTFTFGGVQITGETAVVSVSGECSDGSFPTEVELVYGPFSDVASAQDLGDGDYEFTIDVAAGATEDQLQSELGLEPDLIEASIESTCV